MRGFSACVAPPSSHVVWAQGPGWQGGKSPYHPTNTDACSALGVVLLFFPPLLCPTRISEKSTFHISSALWSRIKESGLHLLVVQRCFSSQFAVKGHFANRLPTEQQRRPQLFALLDLQCHWIYDLLIASEPLYEIVSDLVSLHIWVTSQLTFLFSLCPALFSC